MGYPIIIMHRGASDYLKWAIKQAKLNNDNVVLLGDKSNENFREFCSFGYLDDLDNAYSRKFTGLYEHMSTNNYKFELMCIDRWFVLLQYMVRENIEYLVHLDSDVMVYTNLDETVETYLREHLMCYHVIEQDYNAMRWVAGAGFSFWTMKGLKLFCDFIIDQYTQGIGELRAKWKWHHDTGRRGGICDMNLLYLFYQKNKDSIRNLSLISDDETSCFDLNLASGANYYQDEYRIKRTLFGDYIKQITFIRNQPFGYNLRLKRKVAFHSLHCQGKYKILMYSYYSGKKSFDDLLGFLNFAGPFLWKRFRELLRYKFDRSRS
jgi:hypothetical protein